MARPFGGRAGLDAPARSEVGGVDVFLSHVEEDQTVALELADALDAAGYSTWCYERDTIPGPSYLLQTSRAIEQSRAVVVLISADSLGSHQVTSEVVRAHEEVRPFIPLLIGITREEFGARQPEWREAIGSAATLDLPAAGVPAVLPRIVDGLTALGVAPHEGGSPRQKLSYAAEPAAAPAGATVRRLPWRRRRLLVPGIVAVVLAGLAIVLIPRLGGREDSAGRPGTSATSDRSPSPTAGPSTPGQTTPGQTAPTPPATTAPKDAATTPLSTAQGPARLTARATRQYCDLTQQCWTAPNDRVFVLIDVTAWNGGDLIYDTGLSSAASQSYVAYRGQRASGNHSMLLQGAPAGMTVVYAALPPEVAGASVNLFWPGNPPLRVRVSG